MRKSLIYVITVFSFWIRIDSIAVAQLFTPADSYRVGTEPFFTFAADYNNDGYADLATANFGSDNVSILLNNGDGTFAGAVNYGPLIDARDIFAADFDNDGDLDLAVPLVFSNRLAILFNNGNGTFALPPVHYVTGINPVTSFAADYDNDYDLDLAVTNANGNDVSIFLNDSTGTFDLDGNYAVVNHAQSVYGADFEPDGDVDLAVANFYTSSLSILLNNGDATFTSAVQYALSGDSSNSVFTADFNNDGFFDVAVATVFQDVIAILLNSGDSTGTFEPAVNYPAGARTFSVFSVDLDNDGDIYIVATNRNAGSISIFMNQTITTVKEIPGGHPSSFYLDQNYPNPFGPSTKISWQFKVDNR